MQFRKESSSNEKGQYKSEKLFNHGFNMGFPDGDIGKEPICQKKKKKKNLYANAGDIRDLCWIPGLGKTPGGGHGKSCQNSCLENSMDREVWQAIVRVAESDTTEVA